MNVALLAFIPVQEQIDELYDGLRRLAMSETNNQHVLNTAVTNLNLLRERVITNEQIATALRAHDLAVAETHRTHDLALMVLIGLALAFVLVLFWQKLKQIQAGLPKLDS